MRWMSELGDGLLAIAGIVYLSFYLSFYFTSAGDHFMDAAADASESTLV